MKKLRCKWCGGKVGDEERSTLVPKCHGLCVVAVFNGDRDPDTRTDRLLARTIRKAARRAYVDQLERGVMS